MAMRKRRGGRKGRRGRRAQAGMPDFPFGRFSYWAAPITIHGRGQAQLTIGQFCSIAFNVTVFLGDEHYTNWVTTCPYEKMFPDTGVSSHTKGDVTICNDVWVGHGATIMSGITVADGAVIAANSHVVKDVMPYSIVGGNPAKHLRYRFPPDVCAELLELKWWDLPEEKIRPIFRILCSDDIEAALAAIRAAREEDERDAVGAAE